MVQQTLPSLVCPRCQARLEDTRPGTAVSRVSFAEDCRRECRPCGIAFSNALKAPTRIFLHPLDNVPGEVRDGAERVLNCALNERNRQPKWLKFGYSTSEDAITWTVFRYLTSHPILSSLVTRLGWLRDAQTEPLVLLWGAPLQPGIRGQQLRDRLRQILRAAFREEQRSYSEPDVILDFGSDGVIFIEVKYKSPNCIESDGRKFSPYLSGTAFSDSDMIRSSGLYELTRNWAILDQVAGNRPMTLVNLILSGARNKAEQNSLRQFRSGLITSSDRKFVQSTWGELLAVIAGRPAWFSDYLRELNPPLENQPSPLERIHR